MVLESSKTYLLNIRIILLYIMVLFLNVTLKGIFQLHAFIILILLQTL
jgi:hypothetical protein